MKKIIHFLVERWGLATILFLLWQAAIMVFMILTAATHKTSFSVTPEYWVAWASIAIIWTLNLAASYADGRNYLSRDHFPDRLFVPALNHIIFIAVTAGVLGLYLHSSLGVFEAADQLLQGIDDVEQHFTHMLIRITIIPLPV